MVLWDCLPKVTRISLLLMNRVLVVIFLPVLTFPFGLSPQSPFNIFEAMILTLLESESRFQSFQSIHWSDPGKLRNGQCLVCHHLIQDACEQLGEHKGSITDNRGAAKSISSFLSVLPKILNNISQSECVLECSYVIILSGYTPFMDLCHKKRGAPS